MNTVSRGRTLLKVLALTAGWWLAALSPAKPAVAASFDCAKASTSVERAICEDPLLGKLDEALAGNYRAIRAANIGDGARKDLESTQRQWIRERNGCTDKKCIETSYRKRIDAVCEYPVLSGAHPGCVSSDEVKSGTASGPAPSAPAPAANATRPEPAGGAGEVGNRLLVTDPRAAPIFVSKSGTRYWPCRGMVNERVIEAIFNDLVVMAKNEQVRPPLKSLCLYSIGKFMGIDVFSVDHYVSQENLDTCLGRNHCTEFRSATFKVNQGQVFRTYMLTSLDRRLTRQACVKNDGTVISLNQACP